MDLMPSADYDEYYMLVVHIHKCRHSYTEDRNKFMKYHITSMLRHEYKTFFIFSQRAERVIWVFARTNNWTGFSSIKKISYHVWTVWVYCFSHITYPLVKPTACETAPPILLEHIHPVSDTSCGISRNDVWSYCCTVAQDLGGHGEASSLS